MINIIIMIFEDVWRGSQARPTIQASKPNLGKSYYSYILCKWLPVYVPRGMSSWKRERPQHRQDEQ